MDANGLVQVVVEMEPAASTISGRISVAGEPPSGFFGWLELIDRLERAARTGQPEIPFRRVRRPQAQTDDRGGSKCEVPRDVIS